MKKKIISGLLILAVVLLSAGAGFVAAGENLTLQRAVELAVSRNPAAAQAALLVKRARLAYDKIDFSLKDLGDSALPYELRQALDQVEMMQNMAAAGQEASRNRLALEAQQNYLGLRKAQDGLILAGLSLERALEQKRLAEAAFRAGTVARSDVLGAEAQAESARAQLFAAESALKTAEMSLNKTLGQALDTPVAFSGDFKLPEVAEADLQAGLESALANNIQVIDARENMDLKEKAFALAKSAYTPNVFMYREAELNLEEARLNKEVVLDSVTLQVYQLFQTLAGMEKQLSALEKSVEFAAEGYRLARLRYEVGFATQSEVQGALVSLSELENRLLEARYDRYLTYLQWLFVTGRPVQ